VIVSDPSFSVGPITLSEDELVAHHRALAERYRRMAEAETRRFVREGLLDLARQCKAAAERIAGST
jgi:hypothetical protein